MSERLITIGPGERLVILGAGIPIKPRPPEGTRIVPPPPGLPPPPPGVVMRPLPVAEKAPPTGPWWAPYSMGLRPGERMPPVTPPRPLTQILGESGVVSNIVSRIDSVRASLGLPPSILSTLIVRRKTQTEYQPLETEYQLLETEVIGVESR